MSLLVDGAAHLVIPDGVVSSGEPSLYAFIRALGFDVDVWQRQINRLAYAKRADGLWAARNVDLSVCRQAGKTYDISFIPFHRCIMQPRFTAIWTTHHFSVTQDTFETMRDMALMDEMHPFIDPDHGVYSAAGKEAIMFRNGSKIAFKARENGAIRGFKRVGLLVLDEAQHLSDSALAGVLPTQNRALNPQTFYMGTPPGPKSQGEVFTRHRANALAGKTEGTAYVEFSADVDADLLDRAQWRKANPSYPLHTSDDAILNLYEQLAADDFKRECLGIWVDNGARSVITAAEWEACVAAARPEGEGVDSFAIDMPPSRDVVCVGACRKYDDGRVHVEVAEYRNVRSDGFGWVVDWVAKRWRRAAAVVVDGQSPALTLLPDLQKAGVRVTVTSSNDMGQACGRLLDLLHTGKLSHLPDEAQPQLAAAAHNLTTRPIGRSGAVGWNKLAADVDISPMVAVTLATHGAFTTRRDPRRRQEMAF